MFSGKRRLETQPTTERDMDYEEYAAVTEIQRAIKAQNRPLSAAAQKLRSEILADPTTPGAKYAAEMQKWRDRLQGEAQAVADEEFARRVRAVIEEHEAATAKNTETQDCIATLAAIVAGDSPAIKAGKAFVESILKDETLAKAKAGAKANIERRLEGITPKDADLEVAAGVAEPNKPTDLHSVVGELVVKKAELLKKRERLFNAKQAEEWALGDWHRERLSANERAIAQITAELQATGVDVEITKK